MLRHIETYVLQAEYAIPQLEDIKECVEIAKRDNCIVELQWTMTYSGTYSRYIQATDDPEVFYKEEMPSVYPV